MLKQTAPHEWEIVPAPFPKELKDASGTVLNLVILVMLVITMAVVGLALRDLQRCTARFSPNRARR